MGEREDGRTMRLIMEKGPLEGQTREFMPRSGSEIKIGRVVRGNTLTIKDAGISSKHSSICFNSNPGRVGYWTVSDLGSSNGTFLNGQGLEPFTPTPLSDGDVIKIGELTSIVVKFEDIRVDVEESKVRRNPVRRRGRNLGMADEKKEMMLGKDDENKENVRGRSRIGKAVLQNNEVAEVERFNEEQTMSSKRVTRSAAGERIGVEADLGEMKILGGACSGRNRIKKEEKLDENGVGDAEEPRHLGQEGENCIETEVGMRPKGIQEDNLKRTKRSLKKEHNLELLDGNELENSEAGKMILPIEAKAVENMSLRRSTRNSRKGGNAESLGENGGANTKRGRGRRGKKNMGMVTLIEDDETAEIGKEEVVEKLNSVRGAMEEVKEGSREEGEGLEESVEKGVQLAAEGCEALASTSAVKANEGIEVDLEKITLGEWLDFLDAHLPQQIIDATENMILDMRQKAEKFHDFMLEQKNSSACELG